MNFSTTDIKVLISLVMMVMLISITVSAAGLGDVDLDDTPELDVDSDSFELVDDMPTRPGERFGFEGEIQKFGSETDTINSNYQFSISDNDVNNDENVEVLIELHENNDDVDKGEIYDDSTYIFESENEAITHVLEHQGNELRVTLQVESIETNEDGEITDWSVSYEWQFTEDDGGLIDGIFRIADLFQFAVAITAYIILAIAEILINTVIMVAQLGSFTIELLNWILNSYTSAISDAPSSISLFVSLPVILIMLYLLKLVIILVQTVWI